MLEDAAKSGAEWIDLEHDAGMDIDRRFSGGWGQGPAFVALSGGNARQGDFARKAGKHVQNGRRCPENCNPGPVGRG